MYGPLQRTASNSTSLPLPAKIRCSGLSLTSSSSHQNSLRIASAQNAARGHGQQLHSPLYPPRPHHHPLVFDRNLLCPGKKTTGLLIFSGHVSQCVLSHRLLGMLAQRPTTSCVIGRNEEKSKSFSCQTRIYCRSFTSAEDDLNSPETSDWTEDLRLWSPLDV